MTEARPRAAFRVPAPLLWRRLWALALLSAALLGGARGVGAQETIVYLVRHAERASGEADSPLSEAGRERAGTLERLLRDAPLRSVSSTDTRRTRDTAAPVARAHGLTVEIYDGGDPAALVERLRAAPGQHLIVGHSNTVPELVRLLGGEPMGEIADDEYDRFYVVVPGDGQGRVPSALLRFGAESGGGGEELLEVAGDQRGGRAGGAPER